MTERLQFTGEVKLDIKERKSELCHLKNWFKCCIQIEAIKCCPCYIKINLYNFDDAVRVRPITVIRINIPGVEIESSSSRTKAHSFGVFWKNNRKRCKIFFGFTKKTECDLQLMWVRMQVENLELYRVDLLENRRLSFEQQQIHLSRELKDILGPLPDIPSYVGDPSSRWSLRRASGFSGIYEEIMDPTNDGSQGKTMTPRASIASGIYVAMISPPAQCDFSELPSPPLPPRPRQHRAYTEPNIQAMKQKKSTWNIFDNVFGRRKRADSCSNSTQNGSPKTPSSESKRPIATPLGDMKHIEQLKNFELMAQRRASFSSPDLTNAIEFTDGQDVVDASRSFDNGNDDDFDVVDIERSNSLNCSSSQPLSTLAALQALNVSENILWSHNLSSASLTACDLSHVNLVGANMNDSQMQSDIFVEEPKATQQREAITKAKFARDRIEAERNVTFQRDYSVRIRQVANVSIENEATQAKITRVIEHPSGYCQMIPILTPGFESGEERSHRNGGSSRVVEHPSGYCEMAPIIPSPSSLQTRPSIDEISVRNITFQRTFDSDKETISMEDFSLVSNDTYVSHHGSCIDENSSSGVSSDEGAIHTSSSVTSNASPTPITSQSSDEAICSYSPTMPIESPISGRLDEKYPSYFPNNTSQAKYRPRKFDQHFDSQRNNEMVIGSSPNKIQIKKNSLHDVAGTPKKINGYIKSNVNKPTNRTPPPVEKHHKLCSQHSSFYNNNIKQSFLSKEAPSPKLADRSTLPSLKDRKDYTESCRKTTSSPRRIYNKCATLATRLTTSSTSANGNGTPSTASMPMATTPLTVINDVSSLPSPCRSRSSKLELPTDASGGIKKFVTLPRFRKIDFSPLKVKITNMLQRNADI